jgi:hypothetical protein
VRRVRVRATTFQLAGWGDGWGDGRRDPEKEALMRGEIAVVGKATRGAAGGQ